jgi:Yip1-like protein
MTTFPHRLMGASVLDVATYEEVEADRTATAQAFVVVLASSLAGGIGATGFVREGTPIVAGVFFWSAVTLIAWATWALLVFEIGGRLLPEPETRVDVGELLRTIGFSAAPGILRVFGVVPDLTLPVFVLTTVWMLVAMVVAVRQALDYRSTWRAIGVCTLGLAFALILAVAFGIFLGPRVS